MERTHKKQYIGFEPSGKPHIGILPIFLAMKKIDTILFIANWHASINGKNIYKGFIDEISMIALMCDLPYEISEAKEDYLKDICELELKVAQALTTNRVQKALTITGKEHKGSERSAILRYITLQVADPFFLEATHIVSGEDQRSCSVLSLEVAEQLGFDKPTFETHKLLLNTRAKSINDKKMSKSEPETCIFFTDTLEEVTNKINNATDIFINQLLTLMGQTISENWQDNRFSVIDIISPYLFTINSFTQDDCLFTEIISQGENYKINKRTSINGKN